MLLYFGSITMLPAAPGFMCDVDHRGADFMLEEEPMSRVESPDQAADERSYVSRGGIKLHNALLACGLDVAGRRALDVGASTGGFSDCLLRAGATHVVAVDVGYGQLAWSLRTDPRVTVLERTNARYLTPDMLPYAPEVATIDVSFISLAKILPAVLACMSCGRRDVLAMIKPQFEVGRGRVGKGGVVRDPADRRDALVSVGEAALALGAGVLGYHYSGLPGPKGNRETFIHLVEPEREGAVGAADVDGAGERLREMALDAEPA